MIKCLWLSHYLQNGQDLVKRPRQNDRHIRDDIFKCIFLDEMYGVRLRFHLSLFLRIQLKIFHNWFWQWLGTGQVTSHCVNQWWLVYWRICVTRPQLVNLNFGLVTPYGDIELVSILVQMRVCCTLPPSHYIYLNQYWLIIKRYYDIHLSAIAQKGAHELNPLHVFGTYTFKIATISQGSMSFKHHSWKLWVCVHHSLKWTCLASGTLLH